jgi:hypothetical protein
LIKSRVGLGLPIYLFEMDHDSVRAYSPIIRLRGFVWMD